MDGSVNWENAGRHWRLLIDYTFISITNINILAEKRIFYFVFILQESEIKAD